VQPRREIAQVGDPRPREVDGEAAQLARPLGLGGREALGELEVKDRADELLLGAVVQVALELGAGRVSRLHDAPPRGARLGLPRLGDVALARRALEPPALLGLCDRMAPSTAS
jgi:hypothetical protein